MPAQIRRPVGAIAFVVAALALSMGVGVPAGVARAAECLSAPNSLVPPNGHWYYRTDRALQRKCWYLGAADATSQQGTASVTRQSAPAAGPNSFARFKEFMARRGGANLSDKDVETLYAEFLAWNRRGKD